MSQVWVAFVHNHQEMVYNLSITVKFTDGSIRNFRIKDQFEPLSELRELTEGKCKIPVRFVTTSGFNEKSIPYCVRENIREYLQNTGTRFKIKSYISDASIFTLSIPLYEILFKLNEALDNRQMELNYEVEPEVKRKKQKLY